jgi:hypothetical protein
MLKWRAAAAALSMAVVGGTLVIAAPAAHAGPGQGARVLISSDKEWSAANGVRTGSGTQSDPYVISGWDLGSLEIHDTDSFYVIEDNVISGTLTLNWTGGRARVVDNTIGDLRVNENVDRTGGPTSGLFARNKIDLVGQLRHFDGVFQRNIVGVQGQTDLPFFDTRVVNFDGFNGARFRNNTIYGYMDVKLHGHHHGSGFGANSHDHSTMHDDGGSDVDHSIRYHEVWVTGNKIYSESSYALGFNDRGHAGNDRTAASEENEELNKPHVHHTRVHLNDNTLVGSGIEVDIFNATDDLHSQFAKGVVEIKGNTISVSRTTMDKFEGRDGIGIRDARFVDLFIQDNTISGTFDGTGLLDDDQFDRGIYIDRIEDSHVYMLNNTVTKMGIGAAAFGFLRTEWHMSGFRTEAVGERLQTDGAAPDREGADDGGASEHDHDNDGEDDH